VTYEKIRRFLGVWQGRELMNFWVGEDGLTRIKAINTSSSAVGTTKVFSVQINPTIICSHLQSEIKFLGYRAERSLPPCHSLEVLSSYHSARLLLQLTKIIFVKESQWANLDPDCLPTDYGLIERCCSHFLNTTIHSFAHYNAKTAKFNQEDPPPVSIPWTNAQNGVEESWDLG
jgi:hypothetical protein